MPSTETGTDPIGELTTQVPSASYTPTRRTICWVGAASGELIATASPTGANDRISRTSAGAVRERECAEHQAEHHVLERRMSTQPTMLAMAEIIDPEPVTLAATGRPTKADTTNTARP